MPLTSDTDSIPNFATLPMIYAAHVQAGMEMTKTSAKAHADYLATLNAIAKRLREEKAGDAAEAAPSPGE